MDPGQLLILLIAIGIVALLYSCIGHGGGSGYIAVMLAIGFAPEISKTTALLANILVSSMAAIQFYRAGFFNWKLFRNFAVASVPFAYLGGSLVLPTEAYRLIFGLVLGFSAIRILIRRSERFERATRTPRAFWTLPAGAAIGFLSGLIGVGGGIFLSPLLILTGWAGMLETSAIASFFVLVNSASGLLGHMNTVQNIPSVSIFITAVAFFGGIAGSTLGSRRLPVNVIQKVLSTALMIAAGKLIFF
jgi:uncharacterized protein